MGILDAYRIKKSLAVVFSVRDAASPDAVQAVARLQSIGRPAIPKLIDGLAMAQNPALVVDVLTALLDNETLSLFTHSLTHTDTRVVAGLAKVLAKGTKYDPNRLLTLFTDAKIPKAILEQSLAQKNHLHPKTLISLLPNVDKDGRTVLLRLLDRTATEAALPDLIRAVRSEDVAIRESITRALARFSTEAVRDTLAHLLSDPHKGVRQAAIDGLAGLKMPLDAGSLCHLLRDPEPAIQSKATEVLIAAHDPRTVPHLIDVLQDEAEPIRRNAVQVLQTLVNSGAIKTLFVALKEKEWWIKVRITDTLGMAGGPRLLDAVLPLLKDEDAFVRGAAFDVISATKDQRASNYLLEALKDPDMSIKERAADALATLGDKRAVPVLLRLLQEEPAAGPLAIRGLSALGDRQAVRPLLTQLQNKSSAVRKDALRALVTLTDTEHAADVLQAVMAVRETIDQELKELANNAASTLISKFGDRAVAGGTDTNLNVALSQHMSLLHETTATSTPPKRAPKREELRATVVDTQPVPRTAEGVIDATMLEPGAVVADRYRVIRRVGKGGFGTVLLVEDTMVSEEIILKLLNPDVASDANMIKRFIHELRYARRISHENVIRIYDFLHLDKAHAISMEYFPSHSLSDELKEGVPLHAKRGLKIIWDICRGMGAAHQAGIVHRDLKPPNILINDQGLVKVVDFGLAAINDAESRLTKTGVLLGTPLYMAPEQVRSRSIDARTDIYSLGVIMYEIFTGKPPYTGDDPMSILFQHVEGNPKPPREIQPNLTLGLEAIILKAMEADPARRFQTMEALRKSIVALTKQGHDDTKH